MRTFRNHGISADHRDRAATGSWAYDMEDLGYNYRLTDIQCALGLSQLRKVEGWLAIRRDLAARYTRALGDIKELVLPVTLDDRISAWHLYVVRLRFERLSVGREQVFRALRAENIGVNVHYIPVPWHSYYQDLGYEKGQWPVAEDAYERMLTLPLFPGMSDGDFDDVVRAVVKVVERYAL
jgi:dTDP-4-amino-4,6-dideoxygalactose transaminase